MTSQNSLFRQVGLVLALDAKVDKTLQLLRLDSFHLQTLVLDALAHLTALLEVVQSCLLRRLRIHADLVPAHPQRKTKCVRKIDAMDK